MPKATSVRVRFMCKSKETIADPAYLMRDGKPIALTNTHNYEFRLAHAVLENGSLFATAPSGDLNLSGLRDDLFEVGKEYFLDISIAD